MGVPGPVQKTGENGVGTLSACLVSSVGQVCQKFLSTVLSAWLRLGGNSCGDKDLADFLLDLCT